MGPILSATNDAGSASKKWRKAMTLKKKKGELLHMYHRLRSAAADGHHFKIIKSRVRIIVKKKRKKGNL